MHYDPNWKVAQPEIRYTQNIQPYLTHYMDQKREEGMTVTYFTYGSSANYPFHGGWTAVIAESMKQAIAKFRVVHPDVAEGIINCCDYYTEQDFFNSDMSSGNLGSKLQELIE